MTTTIAEYNETEAALSDLRSKYGNFSADVSTTAGMTEARQVRAALKKCRTRLESRRVEVKAPALAHCKAIDSEARRLTDEILKLETPIDVAITTEEGRREAERLAEERAENEKATRADELIRRMQNGLTTLIGASSLSIQEYSDRLKGYQIEDNVHAQRVIAARIDAVAQLDRLFAATVAQEVGATKLAQDRAEMEAERVERDREEREAREADEKAAAAYKAKLDAEREENERSAREKAANLAAEAKAAREQIEAEQQASREKIAAEERAAQSARDAADAKAKAERDRLEAEDRKARAEQERVAREAREKAEAQLRDERAKLDAERDAAEEKERAEQQAKQNTLDGIALLQSFVARFGETQEFQIMTEQIVDFLKSRAKPQANKAKKAKVA